MNKRIMIVALGMMFVILMGSLLAVGPTEARRDRDDEDNDDWEAPVKGFGRRTWYYARVRAVHLSPDAPNVDIWVDGSKVVSDLAFGEYTGYIPVPPSRGRSTYNIQVVPAGETSPVVINANLRARAFRDYTIVATGRLANIQPLVLEDFRLARSWFRTSVRFVHASPDAPNVDVAVQDGGPVLFSDVSFQEAEDYIRVKRGTYDLEVRVAGTSTVALSVDDVPLQRGRSYTVFATGLLSPGEGEPGLGALLVMDR
jgi:hypothetical protein